MQERLPTVYVPPEGAVVQEREDVNPPEPTPSSQPSNTIPPPSSDSQTSSVEKSKGVSKSDAISQPSGLRPSSLKVRKLIQGRKWTTTTHSDTQAQIKRRKYIVAPSSDSEDETLSMQLQWLRPSVGMVSSNNIASELPGSQRKKRRSLVKEKDIIDTTMVEDLVTANIDAPSIPDDGVHTDGLANPDELAHPDAFIPVDSESSPPLSPNYRHVDIPWETVHKAAQSLGFDHAGVHISTSDQDPQEPDSQRE